MKPTLTILHQAIKFDCLFLAIFKILLAVLLFIGRFAIAHKFVLQISLRIWVFHLLNICFNTIILKKSQEISFIQSKFCLANKVNFFVKF